jgi:hypothetical protein
MSNKTIAKTSNLVLDKGLRASGTLFATGVHYLVYSKTILVIN